ncbi:Cmc1 domain-containing protein [Rhizoctonia solani AG-1 IA]|uniref:COX assembly mitochondrial protein n=1 Tax=Thanatephorus cucumeris (strain AG1-IA) TaxID=983506 RepID=L8X9J4_THACA|nr:Cmc1 domain-containing protein [Rhizoctonia solani AG-1 IA]
MYIWQLRNVKAASSIDQTPPCSPNTGVTLSMWSVDRTKISNKLLVQGFINKYMGGCNRAKEQLDACLRQERVARISKNREEAKKRNQMAKQAWSQLD